MLFFIYGSKKICGELGILHKKICGEIGILHKKICGKQILFSYLHRFNRHFMAERIFKRKIYDRILQWKKENEIMAAEIETMF